MEKPGCARGKGMALGNPGGGGGGGGSIPAPGGNDMLFDTTGGRGSGGKAEAPPSVDCSDAEKGGIDTTKHSFR